LRKSDKRHVDYPVEETPLYLPESEPEIPPIDFESKTCGLEDLQQQIKIEEPIVSTLDDIPDFQDRKNWSTVSVVLQKKMA
jgi:hypothetical protein